MRVPRRVMLLTAAAALAARRTLQTPYELTGRSVLITGGSRGLGLALAREFAARGARLMLAARDGAELERAAADLRARGAQVQTAVADVTDAADVNRLVEETARVYGGLDVLVNNAGLIQTGPLENMTEEDFRDIMEINAFAPLRLTRCALPLLRARRGRVLIVSSVGGKVAVPHLAPYSMSKFASAGLGQALRAELARDGVGVTTVLPGLMRTGSPRNAQVKGQHRKEYALFATLDNLPVMSLDAAEAARRIVNALVRGDAEAMIGGPAQVLRYAQALAPQLTADLLALGTRFLPGPTTSDRAVPGREVESAVTRRNPIKRDAEAQFNEGGPS
ncbi:SDR family NAD(P)-dependent oxidoreductase [Deinococcus gobiensis]|uniref:Short-chain dehydrogenase/reductase SDR n=1 Tax=Deinococcus gobiensis (strain DSM 21396 / JCM 16679 / CGMCC 1.7299 / I-0) TaxID=745776 RepID=H8GWC0_DEIGI|nr:SDR family NAD(P)-dependent oxidoreductase [Deinococcus gobiensis]AFD25670.1 Short-chain dehydrogenase/reductase SDR [Deinococcus gobiensis I-0]